MGRVVSAPVVAEGRHNLQASAVVGVGVVGMLGGRLAQGVPDADTQVCLVSVQVDDERTGKASGPGGLQRVGG